MSIFCIDAVHNEGPMHVNFFFKAEMSESGVDPGGREGTPGAHTPKIGKNMIFWHKIVIFHTKYPKNVHASLCLAQFF